MTQRVFIKLVYEMDPRLWGAKIGSLSDEEVLDLAAQDWLTVLGDAEVSVERIESEETDR